MIEKWFSHFKKSQKLWKEFIPLAFHVSYWNHLSWKDPFSQDFVVTKLIEHSMQNNGNVFQCNFNLKFDQMVKTQSRGLTFWIINRETFEVVQAIGGIF